MTTTPIDDEGTCPCHAFVQLSRRSPRTGEWKSLLDSCPLCVIDTKSTAGSVCSQRCSEKESENRRVDTVAAPAARQRGRNKMSLPPSRRSSSSSSAGSRVRFQPIKDEQFTFAASSTSADAKSVLRASPRYTVSVNSMQQQLDDTVKVTTMSMDMDISMEFSTYDDEGSMSGIINSRNGEKQNVQLDHCMENDDEYADIFAVDEELESPLNRPVLSPSPPQPLQKDSDEASTKMQDGKERSEGNKSAISSRRSYQQVQTARHRPDPEESLCDEVSCSGSQTSNQAYRVRRNTPSQFRSGPSQRQRGRREVGVGGHQQRSKSTSSSFSLYQDCQLSRPQHKASYVTSSTQVSPSTQVENTTQALRSSLGGCFTLDHSNNNRQQQPISNTITNQVPNDDEGLTFTGYSGRSSIASCPVRENSSQEQHENATLSSAPVFTFSTMLTDTNESDPRTGRCIHHPQVRLRKKKLFGRGWKVMMSACPDCCVAELRRIRLAEENRFKLVPSKEVTTQSFCRKISDITDESANTNSRSRSISVAGTDHKDNISSLPSTKMVQSLPPRCSMSQGVHHGRRKCSSRGRSSSVSGTDHKVNISSSPSTKMTQSLPPKRSVSQDVRHGSQTTLSIEVTMHSENDIDSRITNITSSKDSINRVGSDGGETVTSRRGNRSLSRTIRNSLSDGPLNFVNSRMKTTPFSPPPTPPTPPGRSPNQEMIDIIDEKETVISRKRNISLSRTIRNSLSDGPMNFVLSSRMKTTPSSPPPTPPTPPDRFLNQEIIDKEDSVTSRRSRSLSRTIRNSLSDGPVTFVLSPGMKTTPSSPQPTPPTPPGRPLNQDITGGQLSLSFKKNSLHPKPDDTTASITCSDGSIISNIFDNNKRSADKSVSDAEEDDLSEGQQEKRGTIHVRQMRWTDPKNGQSGAYTGQVNACIVPHGRGFMEYDPNPNNDMGGLRVSVVLVKDGEWKDGRFRRNHHCASINDSRSIKRSRSCGVRAVGSKKCDKKMSSSQSSSKSRVINCDDEARRSRSFDSRSIKRSSIGALELVAAKRVMERD